jgi:serine/threonine-protein kinase
VAPSLDAVRTSRQEASASRTREGMIAGTPVYMAPEQAWGKQDRIGPRTDVYCLGATLWHAVAGTAPYAGNAGEVLRAVREGAPAALVTPAPITEELRQIILTAMARDPEARFSSAAALGRALQDLLDGARRREQALRMVDDAETALPRLGTLRAQAVAYQAEAARLAAAAHTWDPIEVKRPIWELEDQAQRLAEAAADEEIRVVHSLHAALSHTEELPEAHRLLARLYRERHEDAEARGDRAEVRRYEALLRAHDDGTHAAWLQGDGALTLITEPAAAEVTLYRYVERDRKLVPEWAKALGPTPLRAVPLPMGSYLLALHRPGHAEVRYPVRIDRNAHWEGAAPGDRQPAPIPLPTVDELGPDDLFVAPGWFTSGGDAQSGTSASRRRVWVDGFVMRRKLVTNREYLAFLNALVDEGRGEEAARHVPRARAGSADALGAPMYAQDPSGHYRLGADDEGDPWLPEYPVLLVDWHSACAYAAWVSQQTGLPWRLPYEAEWEKAARGVDERVFPWGDALEPTRARMRGGSAGKPLPAEVGSYPDDCGPYGHLDLAGNATEWCADLRATELAVDPNGRALTPRVPPEGPANARRSLRGGNWSYTTASARAAARPDLVANSRTETIGFRLCRPYPR